MMKSKLTMCITVLATAVICALCLCACGGKDNYEPVEPIRYFYLHESVSVINDDGYVEVRELETPIDVNARKINGERNFGYELVGAYSQPNGVGTMYFDAYGNRVSGIEIAENEHVYAQYSPRTYKLRLEVDGEVLRSIDVLYGATLSFLDAPESKTGYDFVGWWQMSDGDYVNNITDEQGKVLDDRRVFDASKFLFAVESDNSVCVTARYAPKKYGITFDYNGVKNNVTIDAEYDSVLDLPKVDGIAGYEFIGWSYENSTMDYILYNGEKVTGEFTLYAIFKRYKDVNIVNIDSGENVDSVRIYENSYIVLDELNLNVPRGYEILHWYRNMSGGGAMISVLSYADAGNAVYVELGAIKYSIELIADADVVISGGATRFEYTCEQSLVLPTAEREHCEFKGWCKDKNLSSLPITRIALGTVGNLKLYPFFKGEDVAITLDAQNGDSEKTVIREYGKSYTLEMPSRMGYSFIGWFDSADGGNQYTLENGKSVSELNTVEPFKLYAQWEINRYTVRYTDSQGGVLFTQVYTHGDILQLPTDEPLSGNLTFSGWYDGDDYKTQVTGGVKVTSNLVVYALFLDSKPVRTAADLRAIADNPNGNYHLMCDINLGSEAWTSIDVFGGTLDGKGYKIHNFSLSLTETRACFGFISVNNGTVKNVTFENFSYSVVSAVRDSFNCGIVVGQNNGAVVNCRVVNDTVCRLNVEAEAYNETVSTRFFFGGIIGYNGGVFSDNYANISVTSVITSKCFHVHKGHLGERRYSKFFTYFGGLCGQNVNGVVERCSSETVFNFNTTLYSENDNFAYAESENYLYAGGICGSNRPNGITRLSQSKISIVNNYNTQGNFGAGYGSVKRNLYNFATLFGGILGENEGYLETCYAESDIKAKPIRNSIIGDDVNSSGVGGAVGINWEMGEVKDCYSLAKISVVDDSNADIGGFVGINLGKVLNCYSTGAVSANDNTGRSIGGFCGYMGVGSTTSGCFSVANVTLRSGPGGRFIASSGGTVRQCYFSSNVVMKINGSVSTADNCNDAIEKPEAELVSREFLINILYWDDAVWAMDGGTRPVLAWQA